MDTSDGQYNLQFIKKSRLKQGDIFAMLLGDGKYLFGRLVKYNLDFENSPFAGSNLIYIYNVRSDNKDVDTSILTPDKLLTPPLFTNTILWSKGYAVKVANENITTEKLLAQHCFYSPSRRKYYDEQGKELTAQIEPCGEWVYIVGLSYIDNKISDALGIKRPPLTEDNLWYTSGRGEKIWYEQPISELKKYSNYEEIVKKYPEIIEK